MKSSNGLAVTFVVSSTHLSLPLVQRDELALHFVKKCLARLWSSAKSLIVTCYGRQLVLPAFPLFRLYAQRVSFLSELILPKSEKRQEIERIVVYTG